MKGSVDVTTAGVKVSAHVGTVAETPVRITTGADGSLRIEQTSSSLDIGPNSVIVLPGVDAKSGIERVLQQMGHGLYSVKPRKKDSFVVETPFLVSVVKGTTFSIAVDSSSAAVSLLEGSVAVSGVGIGDEILLEPNQKASRQAGDQSISVTPLETSLPGVVPGIGAAAPLQLAEPIIADSGEMTLQIANDLAEITAAIAERGPGSPPVIVPTLPNTPGAPPLASPGTPESVPGIPGAVPGPNTPDSGNPTFDPGIPSGPTPPASDPGPGAGPVPGDNDEDDGNNGHGNDDGDDNSNPGRGGNHGNGNDHNDDDDNNSGRGRGR